MAKVIGGPLDPAVNEQLKARGDVLSRSNRNIQDIQAFNSKTGWIRMSSSVDVNGTDSKAREYVLGGIALSSSQNQRSGIDFTGDNPGTSAYRKGPLGYRPVPGITSASISAKNRFGTLRVATVNFICWDKDQLSDMEKLFMRPGFSVLLEWGHSMYIDNLGELQTTVDYVNNFFDFRGSSKDQLQQDIKFTKIGTNYNYDAIYGYIKNFQWSFRVDGGYDCTAEIISIGEVIESIKTTFTPGESDAISIDTDDSKEIREARKLSPLHDFLGALVDIEPESYQDFVGIMESSSQEIREALNIQLNANSSATLSYAKVDYFKLRLRSEVGVFSDDYTKLSYITLGDLLLAINNIFMVKESGQSYTSYFTGNRGNPDDVDPATKELKYDPPQFLTYPGHFSLDPKVCVYRHLPFQSPETSYGNYHKFITRLPSLGYQENSYITSIWICVENAFELLRQISSNTNEEERTVEKFLSQLLEQISKNLGGINELDVTFDEIYSKYIVVDRKFPVDKADLTEVSLTGLKSTVTSLNMSSKLSPKLGTIIAVSAQAKNGDPGIEAGNMFRWNEGLTDRISPAKTLTPTPTQSSEQANKSPYLKAKQQVFKAFSTATAEEGKFDYSNDSFSNLTSAHALISRTDLNKHFESKSGAVKPGIIPFELSITLDGIGGIKIGEAFKIAPGILPDDYQDKIAFIVTGVDHNIGSNKWQTSIKAQTITI